MSKVEVGITPEQVPKGSYLELIYKAYPPDKFKFWDYLDYNSDGELLVFPKGKHEELGFSIQELLAVNSPTEIVLPGMAVKRASEFKGLVDEAMQATHYSGGTEIVYASKAAQAAEILLPLGQRLGIEISSGQDAVQLEWAANNRLIDRGEMKVICNGHKVGPADLQVDRGEIDPKFLGGRSLREVPRRPTYLERVVAMHNKGWEVTTIIDSQKELAYLLEQVKDPMGVGLRLNAYGLPHNNFDPKTNISRHGLAIKDMFEFAGKIQQSGKLKLTTIHAMVGAGETITPNDIVEALKVGFEVYCQLKREFPSLEFFNVGGGVPALGFGYDHETLFREIFTMFRDVARSYGVPEPVIQFEPGTPFAAEAGLTAIRVTEEKVNSQEVDGSIVPWWLVDASFMKIIPDQWFIGAEFIPLLANHVLRPVKRVRLGGTTCDSADISPRDKLKTVLVPDIDPNDLPIKQRPIIVYPGTQAYQEALIGQVTDHCLGGDPSEVTPYQKNDGTWSFYWDFPPHPELVRRYLNYDRQMLPFIWAVIDWLKK